jgi:hypothetical protein
MGFATRLGPWLVGTVKFTTGTTPGLLQNTGLTVCSQTTKVNYAGFTAATYTNTIAVLPAGAQIHFINVDTLVAFDNGSAATLTLGDGTTANLYLTSTVITSAGRMASTNLQFGKLCGATSTAAPNGIGIGPTDVKIVATNIISAATANNGTAQYTVIYSVANSDGSQDPTTFIA